MDLQLERNIEAFLKIVTARAKAVIEPDMSWCADPCQFRLEVLPMRLVLGGVVTVAHHDVLARVLQLCVPHNTRGVIQRTFVANNQLYLSCNLPLAEDAFFWSQIATWQQKTLTMCAGRK